MPLLNCSTVFVPAGKMLMWNSLVMKGKSALPPDSEKTTVCFPSALMSVIDSSSPLAPDLLSGPR